MILLALALLPGVAIGYALRGRLRGLAELPLGHVWLLFVAAGLQIGLGVFPADTRESIRVPVVLFSYGLVGVWLAWASWTTRRALRIGFALVAVGWLMNLIPISLNRGMPVSAEAAQIAGIPASEVDADGNLYKHVLLTDDTKAAWLGDTIGVPPPIASAISWGDLVLAFGITVVIAAGMRLRPERPADTSDPVSTPA